LDQSRALHTGYVASSSISSNTLPWRAQLPVPAYDEELHEQQQMVFICCTA
jgi:hypothetical protein